MFDIICLSETYLDFRILPGDDNLDILGYNLVRFDHLSNSKLVQSLQISKYNIDKCDKFTDNLELNLDLVIQNNIYLVVVLDNVNAKLKNWCDCDISSFEWNIIETPFFSVFLSIHLGEDKTKSILFASKFQRKNTKKLCIKYWDIQIKQHSKVKYLGCLLDVTMSEEAMALYVVNKINNKLKFLYRKNSFLTPALRRHSVFMQPHFDYACSAWYPNLIKKLKHRIQTT